LGGQKKAVIELFILVGKIKCYTALGVLARHSTVLHSLSAHNKGPNTILPPLSSTGSSSKELHIFYVLHFIIFFYYFASISENSLFNVVSTSKGITFSRYTWSRHWGFMSIQNTFKFIVFRS